VWPEGSGKLIKFNYLLELNCSLHIQKGLQPRSVFLEKYIGPHVPYVNTVRFEKRQYIIRYKSV
jgi:hypothetical protein